MPYRRAITLFIEVAPGLKRNPGGASLPGDHHFEVFARYHHAGVARPVHADDQRVQVVAEVLPRRRVERRKSLEHRSVKGLEHVEEMIGRAVAEIEHPRLRLDRCGLIAEQLVEPRTRTPERG